MNKELALEAIATEIENCDRCRNGKEGKAVPGEGNADATVMFVGEAPGREEAKTGRPFIGRSGKLLTKLIESIGMTRNEVFITSVCKFYPGMRAPTPGEIELEKPFLLKQIDVIKPKLIVLLGNTAIKAMLGNKHTVTVDRGKIVTIDGQNYFPTYHPAAAIRFKKNLVLIEEDFKKLKEVI